MKKLQLLIIVTALGLSSMFAQQIPQYTQYMLNDYVINPALTGVKDFYQAKANYRYQWAGITDAPVTYGLSLYGPDKDRDMGYGGYIFNDVTGPTSKIGAYFSYSYMIRINYDLKLSMGLAAGILQYKVDGTKINMLDRYDPSIGGTLYDTKKPDAKFGLYLYNDKFNVGFSASQLFNNELEIYNSETASLNRLKTHFYLVGGYKYSPTYDITIEPSLLMKMVAPAPPQFDISVRGIYREMVWLGFSYRTQDAIAFLIGYNYKDQLSFGYAYDMSTSSIRAFNNGTHEIMLSIRFNQVKNFNEDSLD